MSRHVLVGFDGSEQAEAALVEALSLFPGATVTAVHVTDPREWYSAEEDAAGEDSYEVLREAGERNLERATEIASAHDRTIGTELLAGQPARELVGYAEEHDVDHVVVGSHGREGLARFLLGSVAERIVRRSPVPVTVVRADDRS